MNGYFDRVEKQLVHRVEAGVPRRPLMALRLNLVAPAVSVAVALVVVAVFLSIHSATRSPTASSNGTLELVYQAEPTAQTPTVTPSALRRAVTIMHVRLAQLGVARSSITTAHNDIVVQLPGSVHDTARAEAEVGTTAKLYFYDWEASALLPDGATVASKLLAQDQSALTISQGSGAPGAGSMTLYGAVKLAANRPRSNGGSNFGNLYYMFGRGGTPACAAAAKFYGVVEAAPGQHCLLSGPDDSTAHLHQGLPPGVTAAQGQTLFIKPGTVVLQAVPASFSSPPKPAAPNTQFYALRDDVALTGNQLTHPRTSTDTGGNPDVTFGFTRGGAKAFTNLTSAIAHRGSLVSGAGLKLQQHFGVALDGVLITVPQIDFTTYPDGIPSNDGMQIAAGLTVGTARDLANEFRDGALPIGLKLISTKQLPSHR